MECIYHTINVYRIICDVFIDEQKVFTGLYFQDAVMKYNFNCFSEVIIFDATYILNELHMPLYLIDGNG